MISGNDSGPISVRAGFKPGDHVGAYQLVRKIGAGGMGTVFEARHEELGRRCAIKILKDELSSNPKIVRRFFNEARAVAKIRHENIIDVYDFGQNGDGRYYFIMELLEGVSLSDELKKGPLPLKRACFIAGQIARALAASHTAGIVHRDLKPANLMLIRRAHLVDFVKVLDFGVAKLIHKSGDDDTETGMVIGTTRYMSPEQCRAGKEVDHRSDIYALGMLLYHMIAGRLPFDADNPGDMMVQHLTAVPSALSTHVHDLPPEVDALVTRTLAKDPADRIQRMDDFADALVPFGAPARPPDVPAHEPAIPTSFDDLDVEETPALGPVTPVSTEAPLLPATSVERRRPRRRLFWPLAAGALVLAGVGVVGSLVASRPKPATEARVEPVHAAPTPTLPETIKVSIVTTPSGVQVLLGADASPAGVTPLDLKVRRGDQSVRLHFVKDGFDPLDQDIVPALDQQLNLMLHPLPAAPAPRPTASKSKLRPTTKQAPARPVDGLLAPSY